MNQTDGVDGIAKLIKKYAPSLESYEETYKHIHSHPELSRCEAETAKLVQAHLSKLDSYTVKPKIGGHGVVGILANGSGPTILLRADMDALPVEEKTGVPYASTKRMQDYEGVEQPVMHACGHDVHVTSLLATAELMHSSRSEWAGTLVVCFQPSEELPPGAQGMVDDGMYDPKRHAVPIPDVVLAGHVGPTKAGTVAMKEGLMLLGGNSFQITFHGKGAHASSPHLAIEPILTAAAFVTRVQAVAARELAWSEKAIATVAAIHAGSADNVIPAEAYVLMNIRIAEAAVRERVLEAIKRVARAENAASGATVEPTFDMRSTFPVTENDDKVTGKLSKSFGKHFGGNFEVMQKPGQASEDFSILASHVDKPYAFWFYGGIDPELYDKREKEGKLNDIPANHSAYFSPVIQPTLRSAMEALAVAALTWLKK